MKNAAAAAGTPKMFRVFRIPIATAASATRRRNGNMMRVISTVSSTLPGMSANPGAIAWTMAGANHIPSNVRMPTTTASALITRLASRQAAASPPRSRYCVKVLTKAADSAPSANRSRRRFGMRKAVMKASSSRPAPNKTAKTCSRTTPRTRLASTAALTTLARRASRARPPVSAAGGAAVLRAVGSGIMAPRGTRSGRVAQMLGPYAARRFAAATASRGSGGVAAGACAPGAAASVAATSAAAWSRQRSAKASPRRT